jgi:hypothetical protein
VSEAAARSGRVPIGAVIPVYNKRRFLERSLESVLSAGARAGKVEVVVLDNGSTDGSRALAERICAGRARVAGAGSTTVAGVRNAGARLVEAPLLAFIDGDCVVGPDHFIELRAVFERPDVAATGCRVEYPPDGPWVERAWGRLRGAPREGFRRYLNSGNFAVRREAFQAVGGFDERLVTGEDAALGQRLGDRGYRVWETPRLRTLHLDNPTTLGAFFRKEVWHADGMFGTVRATSLDRPTAMTAAHLALLVGAVGVPAWMPGGLGARLVAAVALVFLVPAATVAYRVATERRTVPPVASVVLYQAYYLARITALVRLALRALLRRGGGPSRGAGGETGGSGASAAGLGSPPGRGSP